MDEDIIKEYYRYYGYPSSQKLIKIIKKDFPEIKMNQIQQVIGEQQPYQLHKKTKDIVKGHMVAFQQNEKWLADLLDISNLSRDNRGFKWILLVIDVFTRQGYAEGIKSKEASDVLSAFKKITEKHGTPFVLISDNGSEFINRQFQQYLKDNNIMHQTSEPQYHKTLGLIDR